MVFSSSTNKERLGKIFWVREKIAKNLRCDFNKKKKSLRKGQECHSQTPMNSRERA
jgi:hypothetical protein